MDDTFYYESPCTTEVVNFHAVKYLGIYKFVSEKSFSGVACKVGESVNIGNIQHKVCNPKQSPHMYCYSKTKSLWREEVSFKVFKKNDEGDWVYGTTIPKSTYIEFKVGCDCGWQRHLAGDSNENRAGEQ